MLKKASQLSDIIFNHDPLIEVYRQSNGNIDSFLISAEANEAAQDFINMLPFNVGFTPSQVVKEFVDRI